MSALRMSGLLLLVLLTSACGPSGPTSEQSSKLQAVMQENHALLAAGRISHVQAAERVNAATEEIFGARLAGDRLLASYRLALASQIDAGQITQEVANYQWQERIAEINAQNQTAAQAAALSSLADGLQQAALVSQGR